jgi:hypothetical protein
MLVAVRGPGGDASGGNVEGQFIGKRKKTTAGKMGKGLFDMSEMSTNALVLLVLGVRAFSLPTNWLISGAPFLPIFITQLCWSALATPVDLSILEGKCNRVERCSSPDLHLPPDMCLTTSDRPLHSMSGSHRLPNQQLFERASFISTAGLLVWP